MRTRTVTARENTAQNDPTPHTTHPLSLIRSPRSFFPLYVTCQFFRSRLAVCAGEQAEGQNPRFPPFAALREYIQHFCRAWWYGVTMIRHSLIASPWVAPPFCVRLRTIALSCPHLRVFQSLSISIICAIAQTPKCIIGNGVELLLQPFFLQIETWMASFPMTSASTFICPESGRLNILSRHKGRFQEFDHFPHRSYGGGFWSSSSSSSPGVTSGGDWQRHQGSTWRPRCACSLSSYY